MMKPRWASASLGHKILGQVKTVSGLSLFDVIVNDSSGGVGSEKR